MFPLFTFPVNKNDSAQKQYWKYTCCMNAPGEMWTDSYLFAPD